MQKIQYGYEILFFSFVVNVGDYIQAVLDRNLAENISRVLYPNDNVSTHTSQYYKTLSEICVCVCVPDEVNVQRGRTESKDLWYTICVLVTKYNLCIFRCWYATYGLVAWHKQTENFYLVQQYHRYV